MQLTRFGRTGVRVSRIGLGTGGFGAAGSEERECIRMVHAALDAGINFIDTADIYGRGAAEEILGKALKGRRGQVVLASKFWAPMRAEPNCGGVSRLWIMRAIHASLRRLDTDYIDVYMQHRPEFDVDLDESLGAMTDLVRRGDVRYIGGSSFPAEMLVEAEWLADRRCRERLACNEVTYSINVRANETSVFPTCQRFGAAVLAFSPLDSGWLGGRHRKATGIHQDGHWARILPERFAPGSAENARKLDIVERLAELADQAAITLPQLALAWTLEHPAVTAAIIGARTVQQLNALLPAVDIRLDAQLLDRIDELVMPGTTVNPLDDQWTPPSSGPARTLVYPRRPSLEAAARRRR